MRDGGCNYNCNNRSVLYWQHEEQHRAARARSGNSWEELLPSELAPEVHADQFRLAGLLECYLQDLRTFAMWFSTCRPATSAVRAAHLQKRLTRLMGRITEQLHQVDVQVRLIMVIWLVSVIIVILEVRS